MSKALQEIPSPMQLRGELEQMVVKDLLGPAESPEEELDERSVRDRYLVGVLAPRKQGQEPRPIGDGEEDGEFPPVELDELEVEGSESEEDGPQEFSAPLPKATFPSSFGMTFCVSSETKKVRVTASWGQYLKQESEHLVSDKTGNPKRVWKRHPRGGSHPVKLNVGAIPPFLVDDECPQVFVQGVARRRDGDWIVTLFLVNGQEEPRINKDSAWLFQPELVVEAADGSPIFCKRVGRLDSAKLDPVTAEEDAALAKWGKTPFRIGLWVGRRTTPNTTKQSAEAVKLAHGQREGAGSVGGIGTPYQLTNCPWCGSKIERGKQHVTVEEFNQGAGRTFIYCGNPIGMRCPFTATSAPKEGLPVMVVDEEIYRRLPTLLIATTPRSISTSKRCR